MTTTTPTRPRPTRTTTRPTRTTTAPRTTRTAAPARKRTPAAVPRNARPAAPPRTPFVLLVVGLLGGALVSLLLLNTVLAQDAFTLTELQRNNKQLIQQRQALQEEIAREESPARLAPKAKALGMREPHQPAFVDAQTGQTIGRNVRPVPPDAAAAAAAASVAGVPGAVVPGDGDRAAGTRSGAAR